MKRAGWYRPRGARTFAFLALALLLGCRQGISLDSVRELSRSAVAAQQSLDDVAQDFHDTCVRKLRWDYLTATLKVVRLSDVEVRRYDAGRCDDPLTLEAVDRWKAFNRLYIGYFAALGTIAGARSDADAYGLQAFAGALVKSGDFANSAGVTTSATFLSAALDEYFNARRRSAIAGFAGEGGEAFIEKTVPGLLAASDTLNASLDEEQQAIDDYYSESASRAKGAPGLLDSIRFREMWSHDLAAVQARRDAIVAYRRAIRVLRTSHATLVAAIRDDRPEALASIAQTYSIEFVPLVERMNKAFR